MGRERGRDYFQVRFSDTLTLTFFFFVIVLFRQIVLLFFNACTVLCAFCCSLNVVLF